MEPMTLVSWFPNTELLGSVVARVTAQARTKLGKSRVIHFFQVLHSFGFRKSSDSPEHTLEGEIVK
jgi:hypothetical protein